MEPEPGQRSAADWLAVGNEEKREESQEVCLFFNSKVGCFNSSCNYAHVPHSRSSAPRPRKQTRDKIKERVEEIFTSQPSLLDLQEELQAEASKHPYALSIIQGHLDTLLPRDPEIHAKWDAKLGFVVGL